MSLDVKSIIKEVGSGVTKPYDAILSSGERVILKVNNNNQGNKTLINEYISYRLALCFGLPVPESGICKVGKLDDKSIMLHEENLGEAFYSKRIDRATLLNNCNIKLVDNKNDFISMILFDHIVYNKDRNAGNLIVAEDKKSIKLHIIDHTHVFKNQTIWDEICFKQGINNNDFNDKQILSSNKYIYDIILNGIECEASELRRISDKFQDRYKNFDYYEVVKDLPSCWECSSNDLYSLGDYIDYRMDHINCMCDLIEDYLFGGCL